MPASERIATFDNDGTLWSEQPVYFQVAFALDRVKTLAPKHPEWTTTQPFKGVLEGDVQGRGRGGRARAVGDRGRHTRRQHDRGIREDRDGLDRDGAPSKTKRLYTDMVFQPMLELLAYLRANGFKTFIVSGGGVEFMRPWTERVNGIPR